MFEVNDVIKFRPGGDKKEKLQTGLVTKVLDENYVSCVLADGSVVSHVYVGYAEATGRKIGISEFLSWLLNE